MTQITCTCPCGNVSFGILGNPLLRILCHCTICQRFNEAPFADVIVYSADSVGEPGEDAVKYETYKPPPNVQRGKCQRCGNPAVEKFAVPLFPKLTIVPAAMHPVGSDIPSPIAHLFYDKRLANADDELPKHHGLLASQLSFGKYLFSAKYANRSQGPDRGR